MIITCVTLLISKTIICYTIYNYLQNTSLPSEDLYQREIVSRVLMTHIIYTFPMMIIILCKYFCNALISIRLYKYKYSFIRKYLQPIFTFTHNNDILINCFTNFSIIFQQLQLQNLQVKFHPKANLAKNFQTKNAHLSA